jgi:hypothetical protein
MAAFFRKCAVILIGDFHPGIYTFSANKKVFHILIGSILAAYDWSNSNTVPSIATLIF